MLGLASYAVIAVFAKLLGPMRITFREGTVGGPVALDAATEFREKAALKVQLIAHTLSAS